MLIHVEQGKGDKARLVPLSEVLLGMLRVYWRSYRPDPWLFPGRRCGTHINSRSLTRACSTARQAARLSKPVTPHTLRHYSACLIIPR